MEVIVIDNERKGLELRLEVSKNKVHKATVTYNEPVPLSEFIHCASVMRDNGGGCGSTSVSVPAGATVTKTVQRR